MHFTVPFLAWLVIFICQGNPSALPSPAFSRVTSEKVTGRLSGLRALFFTAITYFFVFFPGRITDILTLPFFFPVTTPFSSTLATTLLLLLNEAPFIPFLIWKRCPTFMVFDALFDAAVFFLARSCTACGFVRTTPQSSKPATVRATSFFFSVLIFLLSSLMP